LDEPKDAGLDDELIGTSPLPVDSIGGTDVRGAASAERALGDFTTPRSVLRLVPLAALVGAVAAGVALGLLHLIGLITHLLYYGEVDSSLVMPSIRRLGAITVVIPIGGGLVVGLMARYGSERIRGHGIPEAMETILMGGSKVEPRLATLKPISSAISIGTGGPFGAEGPIILTGGAFGSVIAQFFRLSAIERRTLLVAGSCAGMAAVFGTPVAAALFGIELLVFEWRPRSMAPIAIAVVVAEAIRIPLAEAHLILSAPLFPVASHATLPPLGVAAAGLVGLAGGLLAWALTGAVYGAEDAFKKLPIHWSWWPAIGGLVVGLGGLIEPRALGVGYAGIGAELAGRLALGALVALLLVKLVIWSVSLGSGTSGGILAPLLIMGAALGGVMAPILPGGSAGVWALIGMAATLAGVTRSPFTAIVFAFELTHDAGVLLALLLACSLAHLLSALVLKRSILTEKVARRGFHVMREYAVDPLEALFVRDVMQTDIATTEPGEPVAELRRQLEAHPVARRQRLYPVIEARGALLGAVSWSDLVESATRNGRAAPLVEIMHRNLVVAYPDETLRLAADRMADHDVGVMPVVDRHGQRRLLGLLSHFDLLSARRRQLAEERHRERVLRVRPQRARARVGAGHR
jgi:CIC family chloride channel protein